VVFELLCTRKLDKFNDVDVDTGYIWLGQHRMASPVDDQARLKHHSRVCFVRPGTYYISACAKILGGGEFVDPNTWLAESHEMVSIACEGSM